MRDPRIEQFLRQNGFGDEDHYRETVPIDAIDLDRSHQNWARAGQPLLPQKIEEYAEEMKRGTQFPALVGYESASGRLVLCDGIQRVEAAILAGRAEVDAYVPPASDLLQREILTFGLNRLNGEPASYEQRLEQGGRLRHNFNLPWTRISEIVGISEAALGKHERAIQNRARWMSMNGGPEDMTLAVFAALNPLRADMVFSGAARLAADANLSADDVTRLVQDITRERNEREQLAVVQQWRERHDIRLRIGQRAWWRSHPGGRHYEPFLTVQRHFGTLTRTFARVHTPQELGLTSPERLHEVREWWEPLKQRVEETLRTAEQVIEAAGVPVASSSVEEVSPETGFAIPKVLTEHPRPATPAGKRRRTKEAVA